MVENNLVQQLLDLLGLPENDVALPLDSGCLELGVLEGLAEAADLLAAAGELGGVLERSNCPGIVQIAYLTTSLIRLLSPQCYLANPCESC